VTLRNLGFLQTKGYRAYPPHILFTIILNFIARHYDLSPLEYITHGDLVVFGQRFGALDSAVDTICENLLDPKGDVHMWYLFSTTDEIIRRKFKHLGMSCFVMIDITQNSNDHVAFSGDFMIYMLRLNSGLRTAHVERMKNQETGKVTYGIKDSVKKTLTPLKEGILAYLKENSTDRIPLQSEHWSALHHEEGKEAARAIALAQIAASEAQGSGQKPVDRAAEELKHFNLVWQGYTVEGDKEAESAADWSKWCAHMADLKKSKYTLWEQLGKESTATSPTGGGSTSPEGGETELSRYVKSQILFGKDFQSVK